MAPLSLWEDTSSEVTYLGWVGDKLIAYDSICSQTNWSRDIEPQVGYATAIEVKLEF
jgi:hypothetical protein